MFIQPIDDDGQVAHRTGGTLRSVGVLGLRIGEQPLPLPDAVVPMRAGVILSQKLTNAVFEKVLDDSNDTSRRIAVAMEWHRFALSNPAVVTLQQRIIAFKTGFEALLQTSNSREGARRLRRLFEAVTAPHVAALPWAGVLWSPTERSNLQRLWNGQTESRSELEDWFITLAFARNSIIHDGVLTTDEYAAPVERPLSRYAGNLFWTADRLLRETVKASISVEALMGARIEERAGHEELGKRLMVFIDSMKSTRDQDPASRDDASTDPSAADDDDDDVDKTGTANPPDEDGEDASIRTAQDCNQRDLAALLQALSCDAANKVRLRKSYATSAPTIEGAAVNERAARHMWIATFEKRSISITAAERDIMEAAGAESSVSRAWPRWD